jgi:P-type Ca2+ transporter type 2C
MTNSEDHNFHNISIENCISQLISSEKGLTADEAAFGIERYGYNEIPETQATNLLHLILKQFKSPLVFILIIAAVISWFAHHKVDTFVILFIVVVNAIIGFTQEYRAEKAVASLRQLIKQSAIALRNGIKNKIPARELVPGDIIYIEEGDIVPADARLIKSGNLRTVESSLTGESVPVSKNTDILPEETPLADRKNMIWKSTHIAGGSAIAIVTGTGLNTAIGNIASTLSGMEIVASHFQKKIKVLSSQMGIFAVGFAVILFVTGYFLRDFDVREIFIFTLAAMVSAIPEGLPAILSVVLAIGAYRMTKRNAIIREFTATETLGAVNVILTDKTGTLTQNTLTVKKLWVYGKEEVDVSGQGWEPVGDFVIKNKIFNPIDDNQFSHLLLIAACSNNSSVNFNAEKKLYQITGDPTEAALLVMAKKAMPEENINVERIDDLPFNSKNKFRASLCLLKHGTELLVIGAPEKIINSSSHILTSEGEVKLNGEISDQIYSQLNEWSEHSLRVIALAYKKYDTKEINDIDHEDFVFAGLAGMIDPPRKDVKEAILNCKGAGIRVIMATGDHLKTAIAIGKEIGIADEDAADDEIGYSEQQLDKLSKVEFDKVIQKVNILARLTPDMKLRIATRLQEKGFLIAMTGDGVNDAPALKKADVGIAMGIMGTDVAREAAQVVLADDNFATIVNAIEEGRIVFNNARQATFFLVTTNFAEILTLLTSVFIGFPLPLTATQILWLNLVTDGTQGVAMATEPGHGEVLKQKPVNPREQILNKSILPFLVINAVVMTTLTLMTFNYFLPEGEDKARTGAFLVMAFTQLFNVMNMRSLKFSAFKIGLFSNKYINIGLVVAIILQISIVEVPFLKDIFRLQRIEIHELFAIIALSSLVLWGGELYKYFKRR